MTLENTNTPCEMKNTSRVKKAFEHFAENTSAHGFLQVSLSKNRFVKVFWICVIITCLAIAWYQGRQLIIQYLEKPVATKIWVQKEAVQTFPLVAICNQNPILKDKFLDLLNTTAFRQQQSTIKELFSKALFSQELKYLLFGHIFQGMSMIAAQNGSAVFQYGNTFNDTILSCTYSQFYNCKNLKQWRQFWHFKYGNCFAFNTGFDQDGNEIETIKAKPGFDNGLNLDISLNLKQYMPEIAEGVSAVVYIGSQEQMEDIFYNNILLKPGLVHYAAYQKKKKIRVDPFNNNSCIKDFTEYFSPLNAQTKITKYSMRICRDFCYDFNFINACNCTTDVAYTKNNPVCTHADFPCLLNVAIGLKNISNECLAQCKFPCEETYYNVLRDSAFYFDYDKDKATNDKLSVCIYSKSSEVEVTEDKLLYQWENLVADLGGHLGLWGGFSILTLMEVLFFCVFVMGNCAGLITGKND